MNENHYMTWFSALRPLARRRVLPSAIKAMKYTVVHCRTHVRVRSDSYTLGVILRFNFTPGHRQL
jgi:hypothetical protein